MKGRKGKVYIVGAGPGEPELITVKGKEILNRADVVIYDYLVDEAILRYAKNDAELIRADEGVKESVPFLMLRKVKDGKKVVRLKNGDPMIFSRSAEELSFLNKHGVDYEIVSGVTAGTAASALSGIPLTARGVASSVVFVTGHEAPCKEGGFVKWEAISSVDTVVIYMGVKCLSEIVDKMRCFKDDNTPVAIIEKIASFQQKILTGTLATIKGIAQREGVSPPAIMIVGEVVRYHKKMDWFRRTKKVLYTGLMKKSDSKDEMIFHLPLVEIQSLSYSPNIKRFFEGLKTFDVLVFTTPYTVSHFYRWLFRMGMDSRDLSGISLACAGTRTREELLRYGIVPDVFPEDEKSLTLVDMVIELAPERVGVLLPGSGDKGIIEQFRKCEVEVYHCRLYSLKPPLYLPDIDFQFFDEVIFPNSQSLINFVNRYGILPSSVKVITTNEKTYKVAEKLGIISTRRSEYVEVI